MIAIVRFVFTFLGGAAGYQIGTRILSRTSFSGIPYFSLVVVAVLAGLLLGFLIGGVLGRQAARVSQHLDRITSRVSGVALVVTAIGLVVGLGVGALASLAVKDLPVVGVFLPPVIFVLSSYIFAFLAYKRHLDLARLVGLKGAGTHGGQAMMSPKLLDTSVIIDARLSDIAPTHFLEGDLIIPGFVLEELQSIADSADGLKRARGRRGLECVSALQHTYERVVILDRDFPGLADVDAKLLKLAREMNARILTTDYNLNKMAQIQGITVLNVNQLANALKAVVLPGESLVVRVIREGKEEDQGVAYLDDGTMVVIEGGRNKLGQDVEVEVTSVLQNPSGKMVFTRLASGGNGRSPQGGSSA